MRESDLLKEFIVNLLEIEAEKEKDQSFTSVDIQMLIGKVRMWKPDLDEDGNLIDPNGESAEEHESNETDDDSDLREDNGNLPPGVSQQDLDRGI
jgi:hypothetical protein